MQGLKPIKNPLFNDIVHTKGTWAEEQGEGWGGAGQQEEGDQDARHRRPPLHTLLASLPGAFISFI